MWYGQKSNTGRRKIKKVNFNPQRVNKPLSLSRNRTQEVNVTVNYYIKVHKKTKIKPLSD